MIQVRQILLRGSGVPDAAISFAPGANILAGDSDTGKSYLVRCLDYIFGADEMKKRIPEAEPYSQLLVEFVDANAQHLTLERHLTGGDLFLHSAAIGSIQSPGTPIAARRSGKSAAVDVTAVLFAAAGIREAKLRKNDRGEVQRLTLRTLMPVLLVDEVSAYTKTRAFGR